MIAVSAKTAAPLASAVQCDSGVLSAGVYYVEMVLAAADTLAVGKGLVVEHRNVGNTANINVLGGCSAGGQLATRVTVKVAAGERVRVIAGTAAGAASSMYVSSLTVILCAEQAYLRNSVGVPV